jgi:hypothetical protein
MTTPPDPSSNSYGIEMWPVTTPSGGQVNLMTEDEAVWYTDRRDQYVAQNKFTNQSDLNDLDRVIFMECIINRLSTWITQGFDYFMTRIDEKLVHQQISEYSKELRQVKKALGIDKVTRDQSKAESVGDYINTVLQRAKEFGYHRNEQYEKSVTLIYQLKTLVLTYDRCDKTEREDLGLSPDSILDWVRTTLVAEWEDLDKSFRANQTTWIRSVQ